MRIKFFVLGLVMYFLILIAIPGFILAEAPSAPSPMSVDKESYRVEDTVTLNISLSPESYNYYFLTISALNNSYTYKGDFNPIMFFYPTEEGIYTIALVEKSTGAIFYSLSFNVTRKPGAAEKDNPSSEVNPGHETPGANQSSNISPLKDDTGKHIGNHTGKYTGNYTGSLSDAGIYEDNSYPTIPGSQANVEKLISAEKRDFLPGEKVRALFSGNITKNQDKYRLYYVFNDSRKKYMGDLSFVEFTPEGIGAHELVLTDENNNVIDTFKFGVVDSIAQRIIRVVNSRGLNEEFSALLYDASGKAVSINHTAGIGETLETLPENLNKTYLLDITNNRAALKRLRIYNLKLENPDAGLKIGIDDVPNDKINLRNKRITKAFAIDPSSLSFTNGIATAVATGTELWKCKAWDFENQVCLGEWEKIMNLTPGQEYNITLTADDPGFAEASITIINVQSYPTYQGNWTVMFNTTGVADLTIRAVEGTTWSYTSGPAPEPEQAIDLRFIDIRCGNQVLPYEWINESVVIRDFSCPERAYETSQVLTVGVHNLEFRFGDDVQYAHNLVVYEYWLQTLNAEFNNGTKTNINVSNDSFKLNNSNSPCTGSPSACGSFSSNPPCSSTCGCTWTPSYCSNNGACAGLTEAPCTACPGCTWSTSSCPLVEAWNGTGWAAEHEAFPFSIFKSVKRTTYDSLPNLACIVGEAKIRIYESLPEITSLGDFKAYAISTNQEQSANPLNANASLLGAGFMKPDIDGRVRFMNKQVLPAKCISTYYSNAECLNLTKDIDKKFAEPKFNSSIIDDWLTLEFDNVSSKDVKLYLVVRKQNFLDSYYIYMAHALGKEQFPVFSEISDFPVISQITNKWWRDSLFFQVEVWDEKNKVWIRQGSFGAGHQLPNSGGADDFLVSLNNTGYIDGEINWLKVRLRFMTGSYGVDYAAIDDSPDPGFELKELTPKSIVFSHNFSEESVSDFKRKMVKDDYFLITYACNGSDEIYTSITGYYTHGSYDPTRKKDVISAWYEYIMLFTFGKEYVIKTAQEKGLNKGGKSLCDFTEAEIEAQKRQDGLFILIALNILSMAIIALALLFIFKQKKALLFVLLIITLLVVLVLIIGLDVPSAFSTAACSGTLNCGSYNASQSGCQGCTQCLWTPDTCSGSASSCNTFSDQGNCATCGCTWQPYFLNGSIISQAKDTGRVNPVYTYLLIVNTTPAGTNISRELRSATTQAGLSSASWYTNVSQLPSLRWVQWRINLSSNGLDTPIVYDVNLTWTFTDNPPNVTSLVYPGDGSTLNFSIISFNFTVTDDFAFTNCTLYGNFSGTWAANKSISSVTNGSVNNITIGVPDGSFIWNILCYDNFDTPQKDWYDYNYSFIVDTTYPTADFSTGTATNGAYKRNDWVYVNVSVIEANEKNITFRLYNQSARINQTTLSPGNRSINFSSLPDGTYYYNVTVCDNVSHCNSTPTRIIYLDNINPSITSWSINATSLMINTYICLNASANDAFAGIDTVTAQVLRPDMAVENITLLDTQITACDSANGNGVYSFEYLVQFSGNFTWQVVYANDTAGNTRQDTVNLEWDVSTFGSMSVSMLSPSANLKINESEYNYQYQQSCSVSCDAGGSNCTNVILYAEYDPGVFEPITTLTTDLVNNENSFNCYNLTAGGATCTHVFNITAGADSGNNIWPIRCSASSSSVGSFVSSSVDLTVNDHPSANFAYPQNNTWINGIVNMNASTSFDSDGSIANYLFEYDNSTAFSSPSTICNSASSNCTWNTTAQDQCENNLKACYLRITVRDNDGLANSAHIILGFDTNGPVTTLDRPQSSSIVSGSSATVNATVVDNEIGNISTVTFEYRVNSTSSWVFACNDNIGPIYDCEWSLSALSDGPDYEFRAYANDTFGNAGAYSTHTGIIVDNSAPQIALLSPETNYIDTDGEITFVYLVSDLSPIANCSLIINKVINQTNSSVQKDTSQYFYLSGLSNGFQANWSINCTDLNGLKNNSVTRNFSVQKNSNMTINLSINRSSYTPGETVSFLNNVTDDYRAGISNVNVTTAVIFANTTVPWWDAAWKRRKPLILTSTSTLTNAMVEVNITGLDNNISSCANEIRIVKLTSLKELVSANRTVIGGDDATYCVVRFRANITAGVNNTDFYAYYNNSAASNPGNNETRLTANATKVAIGGSLITTGAGYNVNGGSYLNTTTDDGAYYAVGRDNGAFSGTDLGAYINLSFNVSTQGVSENDFVAFNFTINYCHSADVTAPITCTGASPGTANNPANADLYNFDSASWTTFDDFFQDTGSANERNESLYNNSGLSRYIHNSTNILWVRYETDVVLGTGADTSFALDYAFLNMFYLEIIYTGVGSTGQTQLLVASNFSTTGYNGLWNWNWSTTGQPTGTYSAVSLASKTSYNNAYDYAWFDLFGDSSAPVIRLISPGNNSFRAGAVVFFYNVSDNNSAVSNCSLVINGSIVNTSLSPLEDTAINFTYSGLGEGTYHWKINCTDPGNNQNSSETRILFIDNTGPVSVLVMPQNNSIINALTGGYIYTVNATVTDSRVGNISTVTFLYRYNSTSSWNIACVDNDTLAPYQCNWNLTLLSNGHDYQVMVYANDSLGNVGLNYTHVNITIVAKPITVSSILLDDNVLIPLNQIDLQTGTTKAVYCNMTITDSEVYTNILGVNATVYSTTTSYSSADNNRTHYANSSCTFITGGGASADYQCSFNVWHFAINGTWNCTAAAWNSYSSTYGTDNATVNQLFALNISASVIDYSNLQPNETSHNVTVNISNVGNMPMNISVYGFGGENEATGTGLSMVCQINNISVSFERFSINNITDYNSKNQLASTPQGIGLTIPPKTAADEIRVNSTYWQFMVPPNAQSFGQCNGSVVFMAESP